MLRRDLPAEGTYHVTARSVHGQPLFVHDVDRLDFLSLYETAARKASWRCHVWCLMDTHYHLVLETSMSALSYAMHRLNTAYAQRFNRRHDRRGISSRAASRRGLSEMSSTSKRPASTCSTIRSAPA